MTYKNLLPILLLSFACSGSASASSVSLFDDSFSITNATGTIAARWGTYSGGNFTPFLGSIYNSNNSGYADVSTPELSVSISQSDNSVVASNTQLALAIVNIAETDSYSSSALQVVLTDSSWLAPTFVSGPSTVSFNFSSNTTALRGTFNYSALGNDTITLATTAVPEPASAAMLGGLFALGYTVTRRRRTTR